MHNILYISIFFLSINFSFNAYAQIKQPASPQFEDYQSTNIHQTYSPGPVYRAGNTPAQNQQANIKYIMELTGNDPAYQKPDINNGFTNKAMQLNQDIIDLLNEASISNTNNKYDNAYYKSSEFLEKSKSFIDAFNTLNDMLSGKTTLSIKNSYYALESAYGNTYLSYKDYCDIIDKSAAYIKSWLLKSGYNIHQNEALHYGLQKFMSDTLSLTYKNKDLNLTQTTKHFPFAYDYIDFKGEKDHRNYFITKCIATGTGQCNSLPGTYLTLAEALGAKTYLSFAPVHSFIKYLDSKGGVHAYEPTSNWKISDQWYIENMSIPFKAIESGIYLDTLNNKMIVANCMIDLALGYMDKFGDADTNFIQTCVSTGLKYFPKKNNIFAYCIEGDMLAHRLSRLLQAYNIKDLKYMDKVPGARALYNELLKNQNEITQLGFQDMPETVYQDLMQQHTVKEKKQIESNLDKKQKRNLFETINY